LASPSPSPATRERPKTPQAIFDRVAPYYDTLNSVLSLGMDRRWRRRATAALGLYPGAHVLDVATGTGALAAEIVRTTSGTVSVTGCDVNERMLAVARRRNLRDKAEIDFVRADATDLPFLSGAFDAVTIAFAIDDMPDRQACVREIARVLRPGGKVALLELGQPDARSVKSAYRVYLRTFRMLGRFSAGGYEHLEQEILAYRGAGAIEDLLGLAGFTRYVATSLTWGIARLHVAAKREAPGR
jgi:demethylmenaquinone methyltransferase/2-methoxy-6-polyprenyl-1,4-benzoquinol methylase